MKEIITKTALTALAFSESHKENWKGVLFEASEDTRKAMESHKENWKDPSVAVGIQANVWIS